LTAAAEFWEQQPSQLAPINSNNLRDNFGLFESVKKGKGSN